VILRVRIVLRRSHVDKKAGPLTVSCRNAEHEIRGRIAGAIKAGRNEFDMPAVVGIERIAEDEALHIRAEFQVVVSATLLKLSK